MRKKKKTETRPPARKSRVRCGARAAKTATILCHLGLGFDHGQPFDDRTTPGDHVGDKRRNRSITARYASCHEHLAVLHTHTYLDLDGRILEELDAVPWLEGARHDLALAAGPALPDGHHSPLAGLVLLGGLQQPVKSSQVKSSQVKSIQHKLSQSKSSQVESSRVKSRRVKSPRRRAKGKHTTTTTTRKGRSRRNRHNTEATPRRSIAWFRREQYPPFSGGGRAASAGSSVVNAREALRDFGSRAMSFVTRQVQKGADGTMHQGPRRSAANTASLLLGYSIAPSPKNRHFPVASPPRHTS